jgi:hypothetical protein
MASRRLCLAVNRAIKRSKMHERTAVLEAGKTASAEGIRRRNLPFRSQRAERACPHHVTGPASGATNYRTDSNQAIAAPGPHVPFIIQANSIPIGVAILASSWAAHELVSDLHAAFIRLKGRGTFCGDPITSPSHTRFDILGPFLEIGCAFWPILDTLVVGSRI